MSAPIISVIVPTYNRGNFVSRCLRSLLLQSLPKSQYEIILVDDSSTDNTSKILDKFNTRIKIIKNKKNMGLPYSLNVGIKSSLGRFIIRVDSDDYVHTDYLKILSLHLLLNDDIDAVCCDYFRVNEKDIHIERINFDKKPIGCCVMFRADQLIKIGLYDEKMILQEDKDLLFRFKKKFKLYRCPIPLYRYFKHNNNLSNNKKKMAEYSKKIKKKYDN